MRARVSAWVERLGDQFWLRPGALVLACLVLAQAGVWLETAGIGTDPSGTGWGYAGGAEGARALLGAIASSTIGVAGTTFSITIAALTLASGQMGPRLLRTFTRDPRNQIALGLFLGTFAYALVVLRTVRTVEETPFVPQLAIAGALVLALACVGTLIWFVHHVASIISVETAVGTVHADLCAAVAERTRETPDPAPPSGLPDGPGLTGPGSGYLQALDAEDLADWAHARGVRLGLRARPGDYVTTGFPLARIEPAGAVPTEEVAAVLGRALTFGSRPTALQDLEYAVRQLSEIAVRALSPGINDPFTAASVVERFGDALCRVATRHLPSGVHEREGRIVLVHPATDYDGLCDAMFHLIRQNAAGSVYVLARMLDVLGRVAEVEGRGPRRAALARHADLVLATGRRDVAEPADLADLAARHGRLRDLCA